MNNNTKIKKKKKKWLKWREKEVLWCDLLSWSSFCVIFLYYPFFGSTVFFIYFFWVSSFVIRWIDVNKLVSNKLWVAIPPYCCFGSFTVKYLNDTRLLRIDHIGKVAEFLALLQTQLNTKHPTITCISM